MSKMHWWTSDSDLENFFEEKGLRGITKIQFQEEKSNGKSKGVATVEFSSSYCFSPLFRMPARYVLQERLFFCTRVSEYANLHENRPLRIHLRTALCAVCSF